MQELKEAVQLIDVAMGPTMSQWAHAGREAHLGYVQPRQYPNDQGDRGDFLTAMMDKAA